MTLIELCYLNDIDEGQSKGFQIQDVSIFIVKKTGHLYGYLNSCPHIGIELDWMPDQFLDSSGALIQCSTHGAQFIIESGLCVAGPCHGERLQVVNIVVDDGRVFLASTIRPHD